MEFNRCHLIKFLLFISSSSSSCKRRTQKDSCRHSNQTNFFLLLFSIQIFPQSQATKSFSINIKMLLLPWIPCGVSILVTSFRTLSPNSIYFQNLIKIFLLCFLLPSAKREIHLLWFCENKTGGFNNQRLILKPIEIVLKISKQSDSMTPGKKERNLFSSL